MQTISNRTIISDGSIYFNNYRVDPFFYSLRKLRWDILLTFHYGEVDCYSDNEYAEKNRRGIIKSLVNQTLKNLKQPRNDIQFAGFTEKKNGRCHTHTLLHIKDKSPLRAHTIAETIKSVIPKEISVRNPTDEEKQVEIIGDAEAATAYICKFNSNELDVHKHHFCGEFLSGFHNMQNMNKND
jgi:hypothetical protein